MKKFILTGIIILISSSTLFRGLYFSYESYGFMAALAFLCILYFISKLRNDEDIHLSKSFVVFGVALVGATVISFINAANPRENFGTLLLYSEMLVLFIVLYDYFYGRIQQFIRCLMIPTVTVGLVCAIAGLMALTDKFFILDVTVFYNRIGSTFQYANAAAIYFVLCLIFVITLVNTEANFIIRSVISGAGSIFIYAIFMTGSRGGYIVISFIIPILLLMLPSSRWINSFFCFISMVIPVFTTLSRFVAATGYNDNLGAALNLATSFLIASIIYMVFFVIYQKITKNKEVKIPNGAKIILGAILVLAITFTVIFRRELLSVLPDVMVKRLNRLITNGFYDNNIQIRLHYNIDALKLITSNWLVGLGGGGWKAMYQSVQNYSYTAAFVHNHYFQVFVENGILGFISFISLIVVSLVGCIYKYVKNKDTLTRTCTAGLFCALVSLAGHAAGDFDLSFVSLMLLLWAMFAAAMTGGKTDTIINCVTCKVGIVAVCSILFSFYGMYFFGAYNENTGFKYIQKGDYVTATAYYEEAKKFDPTNSFYSFELAKLYHYFGRVSKDSNAKEQWLDKARQASLKSVEGCKNYPSYMITLIKIYHDSGMPLDALDVSQKLVECQKYNAEVYELMARSYLEAAKYYKSKGETENARELLKNCINIDQNPYLRRSGITKPQDIDSEKILSKYKHSKKLAGYLEEASNMLENIS